MSNYMTAKPDIIFNLNSPRLDLAYLAALGQKLSSAGNKQEPPVRAKTGAVDNSVSPTPPALTAHGIVNINQAVYDNYQVDDFTLTYNYQGGLLTISDLKGVVAEGTFAAEAKVKPFLAQPDFQGSFSFADLQVAALMAMAVPALQDKLSGAGHGQFKFSGRGSDPDTLKQNISLVGEYGLQKAGLDNIPLTRSLSQLLGLPELENLKAHDMAGNLRLKDGQVNLNSSWSSDHLSGKAVGEIGLDGGLDLPVHLVLGRSLSAKLAKRYPWVKETFNDKEEAEVDLNLAGTLSKPRLQLDKKQVQEQLQKKLGDKILEKLDKKLADKDGESGNKSGKIRPEDILRQFLKK